MKNIVNEDETPLSLCVPDSKRPLRNGNSVLNQRHEVETWNFTQKDLHVDHFWDEEWVIKLDFADKDTKITIEYYARLITETHRELRRKPTGSIICICCMIKLQYSLVAWLNHLRKVQDSLNCHICLTARIWPQETFSFSRIWKNTSEAWKFGAKKNWSGKLLTLFSWVQMVGSGQLWISYWDIGNCALTIMSPI